MRYQLFLYFAYDVNVIEGNNDNVNNGDNANAAPQQQPERQGRHDLFQEANNLAEELNQRQNVGGGLGWANGAPAVDVGGIPPENMPPGGIPPDDNMEVG